MSEETKESIGVNFRSKETTECTSSTTDAFLVPFGELDESPVEQQDLSGLLRQVMCLFRLVLLINLSAI